RSASRLLGIAAMLPPRRRHRPALKLTSGSVGRVDARGEVAERGRHAARTVRHFGEREPHLDARERAREHQVVEVPQVTDPEYLARNLAEPRAERHVERLE